MKKVLINACAAKEGGAKTILDSFLANGLQDNVRYYLLSPNEPNVDADNLVWIRVKTSGFLTYLFTLFFGYFYYLKHGCEVVLSFNNFNFAFPAKHKITYFHNILILDSPDFKYRLIRFTLKYLSSRKDLYIFQTPYVKKCFQLRLQFNPCHRICWPGIDFLDFLKKNPNLECSLSDLKSPTFVVPITDVNLKHKNFSLIKDLAFNLPKIKFIIPTDRDNSFANIVSSNVSFIGKKTRGEFLEILRLSDGVVITSLQETVCLPIFESISLGNVALVYRQPYLEGIKKLFGDIEGVYEFSDFVEFELLLSSGLVKSPRQGGDKFFKYGDWSFLNV